MPAQYLLLQIQEPNLCNVAAQLRTAVDPNGIKLAQQLE